MSPVVTGSLSVEYRTSGTTYRLTYIIGGFGGHGI